MGPRSNVNLPTRTRGDLVAAARAGVKREDLDEHEAKRRERITREIDPESLRAPVERKVGAGNRVELDRSHFDTLQTIAVLAAAWKDKLEATGIPAMEPTMWEHFSRAVNDFTYIEGILGKLGPQRVAATIDLIRLRDEF